MSQSDRNAPTPEEVEEFLENFRAMKEDDQTVLLRIAQYLVEHPEDIPNSMQEMEQLFEKLKRLQ